MKTQGLRVFCDIVSQNQPATRHTTAELRRSKAAHRDVTLARIELRTITGGFHFTREGRDVVSTFAKAADTFSNVPQASLTAGDPPRLSTKRITAYLRGELPRQCDSPQAADRNRRTNPAEAVQA